MTNGTRRVWGVSVTPRPLFTPGKDPVPIVQEAGWAPVPVWADVENLAATGIRSPDGLARSQPDRNEYQEYFMGSKGGRCVGLTTLLLSHVHWLEIWERQAPGTFRACPGLYRDCFTLILLCNSINHPHENEFRPAAEGGNIFANSEAIALTTEKFCFDSWLGQEILSSLKCPDWLCEPPSPSPLFRGYGRLFLRGKTTCMPTT